MQFSDIDFVSMKKYTKNSFLTSYSWSNGSTLTVRDASYPRIGWYKKEEMLCVHVIGAC